MRHGCLKVSPGLSHSRSVLQILNGREWNGIGWTVAWRRAGLGMFLDKHSSYPSRVRLGVVNRGVVLELGVGVVLNVLQGRVA